MWAYVLGVVLFALGILFSVCLHEAGHLGTAKMFGMKVTAYFIGFNPKLISFRRGETEYGIAAIPAGGYCKIAGMTADDMAEMDPSERHRAFIAFPVWKRTIVLVAGSVVHFLLAFVLIWVALVFFGIQQSVPKDQTPAAILKVPSCVVLKNETDKTGNLRTCKAGDPKSPAALAGLRAKDRIVSVNGQPTPTYAAFQKVLGTTAAGKPVRLTYERGGKSARTTVTLIAAERPDPNVKVDPNTPITEVPTKKISTLGIYADIPSRVVKSSPVAATGETFTMMGQIFTGTFDRLIHLPEKIPPLFAAIAGEERDPETPISVVGASMIGGEVVQKSGFDGAAFLLSILASLNVFIGLFNLVPLLPMDGGHVALAWFEKVRSIVAKLRGKPDPGAADPTKLMPLTLTVAVVLALFGIITLTADLVNPVRIFQ